VGIVCLAVLLTCVSSGAWGEPVTTIRDNGDSANRMDLVILGDGYTASQLGKYATDVETFVQSLFAQEPFKEYQRYFNVHRVDVTSNESGPDHPERYPPVFRDTALDATYNCAGIQRLICVNISKVNTQVSRSLPADSRDSILVIVNDTEYGGSGGAIAVASLDPAVVEIILHELGHSIGLLADEYGGPPPPSCNSSIEPPEVNVTKETVRERIKWNIWMSPSTPIPTTSTEAGVPGLYEGAKYCTNGLYRPTYNSKMRNLYLPFEQINEEQLVKRIYNWVSPLDSYFPVAGNLTLPRGQSQAFQVTVPRPLTHSLEETWYVDGGYKGIGFQFTLDSTNLNLGPHTVEVFIDDPTSKVRNDLALVLTETQTWLVQVVNSSQYSLTTSVNPLGAGTVTPSGTNWYNSGQSVSISATANSGYSFSDWSGCDNPSGNICNLTMNTNKNLTANFTSCPNLPVRRAGGSYYWLQDTYNAAVDGDTIQSQAVLFNENPDFNRNISVTISGGYDCSYSKNDQESVVNGTITIRNGTVTLENIKIR